MKNPNKIERKISSYSVILCCVLALYVFIIVMLLIWTALSSVKSDFDSYGFSLPKDGVHFENFITVWQKIGVPVGGKKVGLGSMIINTLGYVGVNSLIQAIVPCLVAYAVVKFPCFYSKLLNTIVIVTMILPIVGAYPSEIQMLNYLNMYDTIYGTWLMKFNFLGMYFLVYMAMIKGISKEYWEAAYIDGAGQFTVFLKVILPLIRNTVSLVLLVRFIEFWNDYQAPLLYIPSYPTLAYGIYDLNTRFDESSTTSIRMAGSIMFAAPIIVLFVIFKDKIMGNITMGGVKE